MAIKKTIFEFDKDELKEIFAERLKVKKESIEINFKARETGDERFGSVCMATYAIEVIVKETV